MIKQPFMKRLILKKKSSPIFLAEMGKKSVSKLVITVCCTILSVSCSKTDDDIVFSSVKATTIGPVSCTRNVYEIEIESPTEKRIVGVVDLPDFYRKPDLQIKLDLLKFDTDGLACVTLSPTTFYRAGKVMLQ